MKKLIITIILVGIIISHNKRNYLIPTDSTGSLIVSEYIKKSYPDTCQIAASNLEGNEFSLLVCVSFKLDIKNLNEREKLTLKIDSIFLAGVFTDSDYKKILDREGLSHNKTFNSLQELEKEGLRFLVYDIGDNNKPLGEEYEIDLSKSEEDLSKNQRKKNVFVRSETFSIKFLFLEFEFIIDNKFSYRDDFSYDDGNEDEKNNGIQEKEISVKFEIKSYTPKGNFGIYYWEIFNFKGFSKDLIKVLMKNFKDVLQGDIKEDKKTLFRYPTKEEKEEFLKKTRGLMVNELSNQSHLLDKIKIVEIEEKSGEEKKE